MSDFAANHLLFEFARNTLDPERKSSVEKALENNSELQSEFIRLINGIQYCEKLSETLVNDAAIKQIEQQSSQVNFIVNRLRWHQWPLGFKWLLEAGVVGLLLVLVLNVLPLNRIIHLSDGQDSQNIIAEVDRKKKADPSAAPANKENPAFDDEELKQAGSATVPVVTAPATTVTVAEPPKPLPEVKPVTTTPATVAVVAPPVAPQPVVKPPPTTVAVEPGPEKTAQAKSTGWIYRGQFLVTNAEMISPKIKDRIKEMGGQKAGEVEIGWLKTPNVYYFHFTIPEAKLAELEVLLKDFSTGKMIKEVHPRIMPDGIVRLLFTVEEKAGNK